MSCLIYWLEHLTRCLYCYADKQPKDISIMSDNGASDDVLTHGMFVIC